MQTLSLFVLLWLAQLLLASVGLTNNNEHHITSRDELAHHVFDLDQPEVSPSTSPEVISTTSGRQVHRIVVLSQEGLSRLEDVFEILDNASLPSVEELDLSWNNISLFGNSLLERMDNLRVLDLSKNPIKVMHDLSSTSLQELYLTNIHLHYIRQSSLRNLTKLRVLDISFNKKFNSFYRDGDLIVPMLEVLNASHCALIKLALGRLENLTHVDFSYNVIETITQSYFVNNTRLQSINLSHNKIQHIDELSFTNNKNLTELNLSFNLLKQLSWTSGLKNLLKLQLRHNKIESTTELRLEHVREVDLSHNHIEVVTEDFDETCPWLLRLNLQSNRIRQIRKLKSRTLQQLNLRDCKISVIDENALNETASLNELDISDNKIKSIVFVLLANSLRNLSMTENLVECECTDLVQMTVANNSALTSDLLCGDLPWDEFCALKELEMADLVLEEEESGSSGHAIGWSITFCLICLGSVLGYTLWRHLKTNKPPQGTENKPELSGVEVDLLEPTKAVGPVRYQYVYVAAPELEEVEPRTTLRREFFVDTKDGTE